MQKFSISPLAMARGLYSHRNLIRKLVVREVAGRYRGSVLGILWSFFHPVFMLAVYTFVFSIVFKARWTEGSESRAEFALVLFAGLLVFNIFAESIARAPSLISVNTNYVKKVIFPLEILPCVVFGAALFHALISFVVWLIFYCIIFAAPPHMTLLLFPLVLFPFSLLVLGLSWFLAALGVFLRDVAQIVGIMITILMFLSPIFYPITAIPEAYRFFLSLNPLAFVIEQTRAVLIFGTGLDWGWFSLFTVASCLVAWFGFAWFQKTRKGFADVL